MLIILRELSPRDRCMGSIRIFVDETVEYLLSPGLGEPITERHGKRVHRRFPIGGGTY